MQDSTGSQQPYIDKARSDISQICTTLSLTGDLRVGLVAFRDHPPQDTLVTEVTPLTADISSIASKLNALRATGGGDGPECQCDALSDALTADWRDEATKIAVLVTDSPPHGIGEAGDGFPGGCPDRMFILEFPANDLLTIIIENDACFIADRMASQGIVLVFLPADLYYAKCNFYRPSMSSPVSLH